MLLSSRWTNDSRDDFSRLFCENWDRFLFKNSDTRDNEGVSYEHGCELDRTRTKDGRERPRALGR